MICVNSVSILPRELYLKAGTTYGYTRVTICPTNATNKAVTWYSSNPSVASVSPSTGHVSANSVGTATITAHAIDGSGCSDSISVTVSQSIPVSAVTLSKTSLALELGAQSVLFASVTPSNATHKGVNWTSSNSAVATVTNGVVTAVAKGSASITATAVDGSGKSASCYVTVGEDILVTSIDVCGARDVMQVGTSQYLDATVYPSNATNKTVVFSSSNESVATVNPQSGLVMAQNEGVATIFATAQDGSGVYGAWQITVTFVLVHSITVSPKHCTLSVDETKTLYVDVYPSNATNKSVVWSSSNTSVATVDRYTGLVTAISDGETTITANSVSGNKTDTCTVVVDSREKVWVKKDNHSFYVEFEDGKIWKNIGIDLSKRQENYNALYQPDMLYENYDDLIEEEQRYLENVYIEDVGFGELIVEETYSVKQIAYLYLLDPLGIEYYMKKHACHDISGTTNKLNYKDRVYEAIFGTNEKETGRFYFRIVDGVPQYGRYEGYDRMDVYSNAEVLFGFHTIIDWDWSTFIRTFIEGLFGLIPGVSETQTGVQIYQSVFHSGGIFGVCSNEAASYVENYVQTSIGNSVEQKLGSMAKKCVNWAWNLVEILADSTFSAFQIPNPKDIDIYNRISNMPDFLTIVEKYDGTLSVEAIIQEHTES